MFLNLKKLSLHAEDCSYSQLTSVQKFGSILESFR